MRRSITLLITLAFTGGFAATTLAAPALDAAGKCRDNGRFVAASKCKTAVPTGACRDIKTKKFARCDAPGTEPVMSTKP